MNTRIVVITGASRGLGLSLAKEFTNNNWRVVGTGLSERPADLPDSVDYKQFDASSWEECEAFWGEVKKQYSEADIYLVNNAGGYVGGSINDTPAEGYQKQLSMNYFPALFMTKALMSVVESARIITIVSATALKPIAKNTAYGASKAAERYFLQALQEEVDSHKFQITNIYPNAIATMGPNPKAITPEELAVFVRAQAELNASYYIRDVTLYSFV